MHTTCVMQGIALRISSGMVAPHLHQEAMPQIVVRISDDDSAWLDSQTRPFHTKSAVVRDLIHTARQGLTAAVDYAPTVSVRKNVEVSQPAVQAVLPSEPAVGEVAVPAAPVIGEPLEKKMDPLVPIQGVSKGGDIREIPAHLFAHTDLIREFWRIKGGSKSDTAWKLLMTELGKIQDSYGDKDLREQLELGINGKWKGITLRNYENFSTKRGGGLNLKPGIGGSTFDWDSINGVSI